MFAEGAVVEDEDVSTGRQLAGAMLLCDDAGVEMPDYLAGGAGDDDDGGDTAEGGEDVAVGQGVDGVDEGPVFARVVGLEGKGGWVEVVDCLP